MGDVASSLISASTEELLREAACGEGTRIYILAKSFVTNLRNFYRFFDIFGDFLLQSGTYMLSTQDFKKKSLQIFFYSWVDDLYIPDCNIFALLVWVLVE